MTNKVRYPRIHLSLDNCFAIKRWVKPEHWMTFIADIPGISNIEASTDNEIDPLFNTPDFRREWVSEVQSFEQKLGLKVRSFYSGYATYRTTGLAHYAESSREQLIKGYFNPIIDVAKALGAQVGNTLSAYSMPVLSDAKTYAEYRSIVVDKLAQMSKYAQKQGVLFSYEQMYTPNQGLWTIDDCVDMMERVYASGAPMYITIDTAHQVGQSKFLRPTAAEIAKMLAQKSTLGRMLGTRAAQLIASGASASEIERALDEASHLFASERDSDVYAWFSSLGCYSPLVHLQQTDGTYSAHKPFTAAVNAGGIIEPRKVFRAIADSYEQTLPYKLPPKVEDIFLSFELFFGITDSEDAIRDALTQSVAYWREALPRDGMLLDELI